MYIYLYKCFDGVLRSWRGWKDPKCRYSPSDGCPKPPFPMVPVVKCAQSGQRRPKPPVQGQLDVRRSPKLSFQAHLDRQFYPKQPVQKYGRAKNVNVAFDT